MAMCYVVLTSYIEQSDGVSGGKPRIAGHRITVTNVAFWYEFEGKSVNEISTESQRLKLGSLTRVRWLSGF